MKTILLFVCVGIIILTLGHTRAVPVSIKQLNISSNSIDTATFNSAIQPILKQNCSPCHFPGGKMYEKMPFDKGETIIRHETGILKRFTDKKEENALIRKFIEQSTLR